MYKLRFARISLALLVELSAWLALSAGFLSVYVLKFSASPQAVAPHFSLVANIVALCFGVRLLVWKFVSRDRGAAWTDAIILALFIFTLAAYYVLVIVGLSSWGRVITWGLISTYARQSNALMSALGISPMLVWASVASAMSLGIFVIRRARLSERWLLPLASVMSGRAAIASAVALFAIFGIRGYDFVANNPAATGEPLSLTFFPEQASRKQQSHRTAGSSALDLIEERARASYVPNANAATRNVVLIVGDALRPDHMSAYGYQRPTTPKIDALLREPGAEKVNSMHAACAESSCGLLAMARSKYVHQLSSRSFSLPDVLRAHGYTINMIMGGDHTNFYGLKESYGQVDHYFDGASAQGYYMNDDKLVVDHVAGLPPWDGKPAFFQFHLMSSHALGKREPESIRYVPAENYGLWAREEDAERAKKGDSTSAVVNYYDNGVGQFDKVVAEVLALLKEKGYLEDSLVVITGDHGEMLGEHGQYSHAKGVYEGVLRIPFLMFRYGYDRPGEVDRGRYASQIDIAPTIVFELGVPASSSWSGEALQMPSSRGFVLAQQGGDVALFDLRDPNRIYKYRKAMDSDREFAYAIRDDGAEQNDLIREVPASLLAKWRLEALPATNITAN